MRRTLLGSVEVAGNAVKHNRSTRLLPHVLCVVSQIHLCLLQSYTTCGAIAEQTGENHRTRTHTSTHTPTHTPTLVHELEPPGVRLC